MSTTDSQKTAEQLDQEVQLLINHSFEIAEEGLSLNGEYDPFGLTLNSFGEVIPFTFELESGAEVDEEELIEELHEVLFQMLSDQKIVAFALGYEISDESQDPPVRTLLVDITHVEDDGVPYYLFPYELKNSKLIFGESYGVER